MDRSDCTEGTKISKERNQYPLNKSPLRSSVPRSFASKTSKPHYRRLLVTSEEHYSSTISGGIYSSGSANYSSWRRYLEAFDEVLVVARVRSSERSEKNREPADGPGVSFRALPDYTGPWQYLSTRREAQIIARRAIAECSVYLLRVPGLVSHMVWSEIVRSGKPYALEVLGDPWDALSPGSWPGILRPAFRLMAAHQLKRICAGATAVHYVTFAALQRRYPPSKNAYTAGFSDVRLENRKVPEELIEARFRRLRELPWNDAKNGSPIHLGFIGSFSGLYKGPDSLLRAAALCDNELNFQLLMVGQGRCLTDMKTLAAKLGISDRVQFLGQLSFGTLIFDFLDNVDLFIVPSRQEGLPRALVEAMSRGCPCIASSVGGIPELLESDDLAPPGSHEKLAKLILRVATDPDRLLAMSARNLAKTAQFTPQTLNKSRRAFLEEVKRRCSLV
jgi:glycosyltransferase involved in cell wall biosynthesis